MEKLKSLFAYLTRRDDASDPELQYSLLRVGVVMLMVAYLGVVWFREPTPSHALALYTVACFLLLGFFIFAWTVLGPAESSLRKVAGIVHDVGGLSGVMYVFGAATAPFYVALLWVVLANGIRYGTSYMALAAALGAAGFAFVISFSSYWQPHTALGVGLLIGVLLLPAVVAGVITRMRHAAEQAAEADRARSRFLSAMSHELRTPLNGMLGMADLLRATPLNHEQEEHARTISVSAASLLALIDEVIDISKIDTGAMALEEVDFDLHRLVANTAKLMSAPASKKCLHLGSRVAPEIPYALNGSEHHLQQILVNLLGNAIKFTEDGHIDLDVTLLRREPGSDLVWVRFEVADTGAGISVEAQQQIFDRVAYADTSSTRRHGGTGLGVTISKRLVEMMGGQMGLSSEEGDGSTFWFELPFRELAAAVQAEPVERRSLGNSRVLVVTGDHSESRRVMNLLSGWGVEALQRDAPAQAIAEMVNAANHGRAYDTVIVDNRGSRSDPVQLLHTAKQDKLLSRLSFVLVSPPLADPDWKQRFLDMGFAAVLPTPFDKTLLFNALHSVCAGDVKDPQVVNFIDHYRREREVLPSLEILVAEDNRVSQTVVRGILEKAGHRVYLVENGEQALDALETHRFDVALFDAQMPVMDGVEALKIYRFAHVNNNPIPVVMLSANTSPEMREDCDNAGAAAFVAKPIQARVLLESLSGILSKDSSDQPGVGANVIGTFVPDEPEMSNAWSPVINVRTLRELEELGGDLQFVDNLVEGFIRDTEGLFEQIGKTIAKRSTRQFRDLSHALKGSAGSIGAARLQELGNRACHISDRDFARMAPIAVSQMRSAFAEAKAALDAYIAERKERKSRS